MSVQDPSELRTSQAHWDQEFQERASEEQRGAHYALASPLFQKLHLNPMFSPDGGDWVEWVRRKLCPDAPLERALVLGCGLGDGLIDFHRRGIARRVHGVDLSATAIETGRALAARAGLERVVTFDVGDFHDHPLEAGAYDVVFMVMSLHHALDLERVLERVRIALKPRGWFVANEYVGPTRWQYPLLQLLLVKLFLTILPRSLRRRPDGTIKGRIGRPTLEWMMATDPSEAAHSAEIPACFARVFELVERVDYGGGVAVLVLDDIVANFREDDPRGMKWFRAICGTDRFTWRRGLVPSANAVLLGRRRG